MNIANKDELDTWLFEHAVIQGHLCDGIKGEDGVNVAWIDTETNERIDIIREDGHDQ